MLIYSRSLKYYKIFITINAQYLLQQLMQMVGYVLAMVIIIGSTALGGPWPPLEVS